MNKITRDDTEHGVEYVRADEAQAEVLEQCRINGMSAEREDSLRAELTRLKASIALDKMADNARELGLDYEPAVQEVRLWAVFCGGCRKEWSVPYQHPGKSICAECEAKCKDTPPAAQPAVQEGRDWSLLEATQESLREHMAEIKRLKAAQPVPVKTYHDGKPWPVAPKPWVGLTDEEIKRGWKESWVDKQAFEAAVWWAEKKLKEKNT
jgi:hypothetical protein